MKKLFLLLMLSPTLCYSQLLNQRIVPTSKYCWDIVQSYDDNLIAVGAGYFEKFDIDNNLISSKSNDYGKEIKILRTLPDNYLLIANKRITDDLTNVQVHRVDDSGDIIETVGFPEDTLHQVIDAISIGDSVHYLVGLKGYLDADSNNRFEGLLMKIDKLGKLIWKRIIPAEFQSPMFLSRVTSLDSDNFIAIGIWGSIVSFDSSGNIQKVISSDSNSLVQRDIVAINESEALIAGYSIFNNVKRLSVTKINTELDIIWTKNTDLGIDLNEIRQIIKNGENECLILCVEKQGITTLAFVNNQGDTLRTAKYPVIFDYAVSGGITLYRILKIEGDKYAAGGVIGGDYYISTMSKLNIDSRNDSYQGICNNDLKYIDLFYLGSEDVSISWQPEIGLNDPSSLTPSLIDFIEGEYVVSATVGSLKASDTILFLPSGYGVKFAADNTYLTSTPFLVQFQNNTPNPDLYSFKWDFGDDSSLQSDENIVSHVYSHNGLYDVSLVAIHQSATHCKDTLYRADLIQTSGGPSVSVNDADYASLFQIYPNPTKGQIHIDLEEIASPDTELIIFDIMGKRVYQQRLTPVGNASIEINNIPPGIYFLYISDGSRNLVEKLLVE